MARSRALHLARLAEGADPAVLRSGFASLLADGRALPSYEEIVRQPGPPAAAATDGAGVAGDAGTVALLHGLLGSGRNLRTLATRLCDLAAERSQQPWGALLVDLRAHGRSARHPGLVAPHTMSAAAGDVAALLSGGGAPGPPASLIVGHSLGGKTSLEVLRQLHHAGKPTPAQVWVLDASPARVEGGGRPGDVGAVLEQVAAIPLPMPSREWLYAHLTQQGFSKGLQQWLGSSLVPDGSGGFVWAFDVDGAISMFESYCSMDYMELLHSPPPGCTIHIVRALRSDRWTPPLVGAVRDAAAATAAHPREGDGRTLLHELPDAGHWLHVDNLPGLLRLMRPYLAAEARHPRAA